VTQPLHTPLLIGAGNRWRRDDGVGAWLVERLGVRLGTAVETRLLSGEGAGLIDAWQGHATVWLFDAAAPSGRPGRVTRIAAHAQPVPAELCHHSTHRFGVGEAIEMARVLGQLPERLELVAVAGLDFGEGEGLSEVLERAAEMQLDELEALLRGVV
jgi:hydrogenase maturation protease